jgi:hypothetical protein
LHLEVVHRLAKAALVGKLDPVVASSAAETLVGSLLGRAGAGVARGGGGDGGQVRGERAAAVMGLAGRYLAWLAGASLVLSARGVAPAGAAREVVAFAVRGRRMVLRAVDPDPPYAAGRRDLGTPLSGAAGVVAWMADFAEFHGAHQAAGMYPVYEILTGAKFLGSYWDGDCVLAALRDALFAGEAPADSAAAEVSRAAFGSVAGFDRVWMLVSAGAVATLRDVRVAHPPELVRPEFTPDPVLLGAYVRAFAGHRYFSTAAQARVALAGAVGRTGQPGDVWHRVRVIRGLAGWAGPVPVVEPHRRLAGCVLAVAARLAPLSDGEPDRQLRVFLSGLPVPVLEAAGRLAVRVLPGPERAEHSGRGAVHEVVDRLRVLQLAGAHAVRAGAR